MSSAAGIDDAAHRIRALHERRAAAELAAADLLCPGADAVGWRGDLLAVVMAVKGLPGPAESSGDPAMSGADGEAFRKAVETLGWPPEQVFYTLSRPEPGLEPARCADRLRAQVEAIDPRVVVALDQTAAADLAAGFGLASIEAERPVTISGRLLVVVDGFEASLGDERAKRASWRQLQYARPAGPLF